MGLTRIIGEKRNGTASARLQGEDIILTETYEFLIEAELPNEQRAVVLSNPNLPRVGFTETNYGAVCSSITVNRVEGNTHYWEVTCVFTTEPLRQIGPQNNPNAPPHEWVPLYELSYESYEEYGFEDANGKAFTNSAHDYFDDGLPIQHSLIRLNFFQYEPPDPSLFQLPGPILTEYGISLRNDTVNLTAFAGYPPYSLKLRVSKATMFWINGFQYWKIDYTLTFKPNTWKFKVRDRGMWYLPNGWTVGDDKVKCQEGIPPNWVTSNLNGSGQRVPVGQLAAVLEFDKFKALEFSDFLRR